MAHVVSCPSLVPGSRIRSYEEHPVIRVTVHLVPKGSVDPRAEGDVESGFVLLRHGRRRLFQAGFCGIRRAHSWHVNPCLQNLTCTNKCVVEYQARSIAETENIGAFEAEAATSPWMWLHCRFGGKDIATRPWLNLNTELRF